MKLKKKSEEVKEEKVDQVEEVEEVVEEVERAVGNPSTLLLNAVNQQVSEVFGLDDSYSLMSFNDGGTAKITLANEDYKVTVEVKGTALMNLKLKLGILD